MMTATLAIACLLVILPVCFRAGQEIGQLIVCLFGLDR